MSDTYGWDGDPFGGGGQPVSGDGGYEYGGAPDTDGLAKLLRRIGNETWFGRLLTSTAAPGQALSGQLTGGMPQTGIWTDEDEARQQLNAQALEDKGGDLANLAVVSGMPGVARAGFADAAKEGATTFGSLIGAGHNGGPPLPQPGANPGGFYSAAQRAVETSPIKGAQTPEQWGAYLKNQPGVKADELESLGLLPGKINPALANESLNKDQLVAHIAPNTPKFEPIVRGEKPKLDETGLEKLHPEEFALLREHGIEPTIDEDQRFLGFWDGDDILHADDYRGDGVDAPRDVRDAVRRLASTFRDGDGSGAPTQYDDWTGIPGHADRSNDPNYRETIYQIQRKGRDSTGPDEIAAEKYQKSWDDVNAQIRAQQERVNEARSANSTSYGDELYKRQQLERMRDQLHDRMVDDTFARKPYWQNRGMTADSDAIMQHAQEGHANQSLPGTGEPNVPWDEKTQSYRSGIYDQARNALDPHGSAPYRFELPHFGGEEDGLYHLRHTEGDILSQGDQFGVRNTVSGNRGPVYGVQEAAQRYIAGLPESIRGQVEIYPTGERSVVGSSHHLEEVQSDWLQKLRDKGYQIPPDQFPPLDKQAEMLGAKIEEVPQPQPRLTPEQFKALERKALEAGFNGPVPPHITAAGGFKDSIGDIAVEKGLMTPEEADAWKYTRNNPPPPGKFSLSYTGKGNGSAFYDTRAEAERDLQSMFRNEAESGAFPDFKYNRNIPDAPFKTKWHELALKQAVLDAVKNGKDAVTWWPGSVHAERYGFDRHVQEIRYDPATQHLTAFPKGGRRGWAGQVKPEDLPDHVGPELAAKLTAPLVKRPSTEFQAWREQNYQMLPPDATPQDAVHFLTDLAHDFPENQSILRLRNEAKQLLPAKYNSVSGDNLKFSDDRAKGMRGFYDTMLPRTANSLFKKYGVKVERDTVKTPRGTGEAHVLKITPKLRETVQHEGLPLFNAGVPLPTILNDGREDER